MTRLQETEEGRKNSCILVSENSNTVYEPQAQHLPTRTSERFLVSKIRITGLEIEYQEIALKLLDSLPASYNHIVFP